VSNSDLRSRLVAALGGVAFVVVGAGCGGAPEPPPGPVSSPVDPATAGTIDGSVLVDGMPPPPEIIRIDGDATCVSISGGNERQTEFIVVGEGSSLQNVFVYVKEGLEKLTFPIPTTPVVLDQQKCRYVPHVLGIQVGQPLSIRNSDPLLHNVRADGQINQPFNLGQPIQGITMTRTFTTSEVMVPFKCDVHAWMSAYVGVLSHPFFAVTDASGRFTLAGLPPGTYTVEAWHEKLGTQTEQVVLRPKETSSIRFTFKL
jgi:hypothetical protein